VFLAGPPAFIATPEKVPAPLALRPPPAYAVRCDNKGETPMAKKARKKASKKSTKKPTKKSAVKSKAKKKSPAKKTKLREKTQKTGGERYWCPSDQRLPYRRRYVHGHRSAPK
jgi:hypothetical protein